MKHIFAIYKHYWVHHTVKGHIAMFGFMVFTTAYYWLLHGSLSGLVSLVGWLFIWPSVVYLISGPRDRDETGTV